MKKLLLASTSTLFGETYLSYLTKDLELFFKDVDIITFVPFARPGGISHDAYTAVVIKAFAKLNKMVNTIDLEESTAGILLNDTISGNQMRQVIANLQSTSIKMAEISKEVQVLVKNVKEGEGALDYLTKDTLLVQKLDATMNNIESGTEKFDKNMEALRHNFLFRGYFKKLEKKQLKEEKSRGGEN